MDYAKKVSEHSHPFKLFKKGMVVKVNDKMQTNYHYILDASPGKLSDPDFKPVYTPAQMLKLGVFEGKYLTDCYKEFPREWYIAALKLDKLRPGGADPRVNAFGIKSRLSLQEWRRRGWIPCHAKDRDPRGWFQWYCRYWLGRRIPEVDTLQIARWKKIKRHLAQVVKHCTHRGQTGKCSDPQNCRPRQRMTLLQWAYPAYI